jgi:hypothetical protein
MSVLKLASKLDEQKPRQMPRALFNACASGAIDPSGVGSFPQVFSDKRFLGFIGTETDLHLALAAAVHRITCHSVKLRVHTTTPPDCRSEPAFNAAISPA